MVLAYEMSVGFRVHFRIIPFEAGIDFGVVSEVRPFLSLGECGL